MNAFKVTTIASGLLLVFLFLRTYLLPSSLLFFNDMGRDFLVLDDWKQSGKPPLLGPQTSAFSYNQSAWYFYVLFPFYFISQSPYSSVISLLSITVLLFIFCVYFFRRNRSIITSLFISFWLFSIHPQIILQNRFIWNPSFIPIFLLTAVFLFFPLYKQFTAKIFFMFVFLLALACGFSYTAVPVAAMLWLLILIAHRKKWLRMLTISITAGVIIFLPLGLFELRHSFALIKLAIHGQVLAQERTDWKSKSENLELFVLANPYTKYTLILSTLLLIIFLAGVRDIIRDNTTDPDKTAKLLIISVWLVLLLLTYVLPIPIQKHYVFPLLTLGIISISLLPQKYSIFLILIFTILWLDPTFILPTFKRAPRTISEMQTCYANYCSHQVEPVYVSMESGLLAGYHNAPDHRFFLRQAGCKIEDIERNQDKATIMLVINDSGTFTPGKTGYRELSLFGPYTVGEKFICTKKLSIQEIMKPSTENSSKIKYLPK